MNRMFKLSTTALAFAVIVAFSMMTSSSANAQSCRSGGYYGGGQAYGGGYYNTGSSYYGGGHGSGISIGGGGISIGVGRNYGYGGYNRGVNLSVYRSPYSGHSTYRRPVYHDTSHLDYHAPSINRHGNHYDYVPGHYDVHRTGHWHR